MQYRHCLLCSSAKRKHNGIKVYMLNPLVWTSQTDAVSHLALLIFTLTGGCVAIICSALSRMYSTAIATHQNLVVLPIRNTASLLAMSVSCRVSPRDRACSDLSTVMLLQRRWTTVRARSLIWTIAEPSSNMLGVKRCRAVNIAPDGQRLDSRLVSTG